MSFPRSLFFKLRYNLIHLDRILIIYKIDIKNGIKSKRIIKYNGTFKRTTNSI